jgi:hypothetical protein
MELEQALKISDITIILVKHRQFVTPGIQHQLISKAALDFCGALYTD